MTKNGSNVFALVQIYQVLGPILEMETRDARNTGRRQQRTI